MVRFQRSVVTTVGRFPEAVVFAKQISSYMKDKYEVDIRVFAKSDGTLFWITDYADYAALGRIRTQLLSDTEYWGMIKKAANLFVESSVEDIILNPIE